MLLLPKPNHSQDTVWKKKKETPFHVHEINIRLRDYFELPWEWVEYNDNRDNFVLQQTTTSTGTIT